jgi:fibronectin type 3 domain-containing protein
MESSSNFFLGNDPDGWVRDAGSFKEVLYEGLYDGIDLRFYFKDGMFKYDFILERAEDVDRIIHRYNGVTGLEINHRTGDLLISTGLGLLRDARPIIFQEGLGSEGGQTGDFTFIDELTCGFSLPSECSPHLPVVIDPGLQFSTYLGGSESEYGYDIELDSEGNIYVIGETYSDDFPTTPGAYSRNLNGRQDAFVTKLDPKASRCLFSTYVGGSDYDYFHQLEVVPGDGIYIFGYTDSLDFPTLGGIYNDPLGDYDALIVKLSLSGNLLYATYIGGSEDDRGHFIEVDAKGDVYVSARTLSDDLPTTQDAYQPEYNSSRTDTDIYLMRLNSSLDRILYCTYFGGTDDEGYSDLYINSSGYIYLAGYTRSGDDFPVTTGAFCTTFHPGYNDAYIALMDPTATRLIAATYLGGNEEDFIWEITGDDEFIYVTGETRSDDYPTTHNAFDRELSSSSDAFLTVLTSDLAALEYSSYWGGNELDYGYEFAWSPSGEMLYLSGETGSPDLFTTPGAFSPRMKDNWEFFLAGFNVSNMSFDYSTFVGGEDIDGQMYDGMTVGSNGMVYITGYSESADFPTTNGTLNTTKQGFYDVCVYMLDPTPVGLPSAPTGLRVEDSGDGFVELAWDPTADKSYQVPWHKIYRNETPANGTYIGYSYWATSYIDTEVTNGKQYYYWVTAVNSVGESPMSQRVSARPLGLPSAPLNLTAETGDGNVKLNWSLPLDLGGADLLGYHIFRGPSLAGLEPIRLFFDKTTYNDTTVDIGELYYYGVLAVTEAGNGTMSNVSVVPVAPPSAPRQFTHTIGDGKITLSWSAPSEDGGSVLLGYRVYRGRSKDEVVLLANLLPRETSHVDKDVEIGKGYYYYVTAFSSVGEGPPSDMLFVLIAGPPGPPLNLTAEPGDRQVSLSWEGPESDGGLAIIGYKLYRGATPAPPSFIGDLGNVTSHMDTGLTNGVEYQFWITAVHDLGEGPKSGAVTVTPYGLPGKPTEFSAEYKDGDVILTWNLPEDLGGADTTTIIIYRGFSASALEILAELPGLTQYIDDSVEAGTIYLYRISAVNPIGGEGPYAELIPFGIPTVPGPVVDPEASGGVGRVVLSWSVPTEDGGSAITGYVILRGTNKNELGPIETQWDQLSFTDEDVENGRTYYYQIIATNGIGSGPPCDFLNATPYAIPGPPIDLDTKEEGDSVVLSWSAPTGPGIAPVTGYIILRGPSSDEMVVLTELGPVLTYTDQDVKKGKTYYYSVRAKSDVGDSEPTAAEKVRYKVKDEPGFAAAAAVLAMATIMLLAIRGRRGNSKLIP